MNVLKSYQREYMGYKDDSGEYKNFRSYYDEYCPWCREHKIFEISRDKFMEHIRKTIDKEKAQNFMDLMFEGYKLGDAQKEIGLSFDEVSITMDASIVNCSHFGKKVKL
jgi:hypothetical protein